MKYPLNATSASFTSNNEVWLLEVILPPKKAHVERAKKIERFISQKSLYRPEKIRKKD